MDELRHIETSLAQMGLLVLLAPLVTGIIQKLKARLVTLSGPGGTGKTRLAQEVAARLREPFQGAVWFVPLVDLTDPTLLKATIRNIPWGMLAQM